MVQAVYKGSRGPSKNFNRWRILKVSKGFSDLRSLKVSEVRSTKIQRSRKLLMRLTKTKYLRAPKSPKTIKRFQKGKFEFGKKRGMVEF